MLDAGLTRLTHLELFCAKITDAGTKFIQSMLCLTITIIISPFNFFFSVLAQKFSVFL